MMIFDEIVRVDGTKKKNYSNIFPFPTQKDEKNKIK